MQIDCGTLNVQCIFLRFYTKSYIMYSKHILGIFQIVKYKILIMYSFSEIHQEILNISGITWIWIFWGNIKYARKFSRSEYSWKIIYFQGIFSFWKINQIFWIFIHFPMHIPKLRINPFSQCLPSDLGNGPRQLSPLSFIHILIHPPSTTWNPAH